MLTVHLRMLPLALLLLAQASWAGSSAPSASGSTPPGIEVPLPEIPPMPAVERPPASAKGAENLASRLAQLRALKVDGPADDDVDIKFLTKDVEPALVPAVASRLDALKNELDGNKARVVLRHARDAGKKAVRVLERKARKAGQGKGAELPEGDWLVFLLAYPKGGDTRDKLAELFAMLRMLEAVGTTPAVRAMVDGYSSFGELVRIDLQRACERLKDKAVPALLEAKQHDAHKVRRWAARQLDALGRAIPGEAVSTTDPAVLADVLRAFGRIKELEATRVILSFANSDRIQLRTAARQAIGALGEPATWYLKDAYESLTGGKAPRAWDWHRTAREVFRLHERARMAQVYALMDQGLRSLGKKDYAAASKSFDRVLARAPLFPNRAAMVPAYLGRADQLLGGEHDEEAMVALRKALRLLPKPDAAGQPGRMIESKLAYLEGKALAAKGTPDRFILERAIELDPTNEPAKKLLAAIRQHGVERQSTTKRYVAAAAVALLGLLGAVFLLTRSRRDTPKPQAPTALPPEPSAHVSETEPVPAPAPASESEPASASESEPE